MSSNTPDTPITAILKHAGNEAEDDYYNEFYTVLKESRINKKQLLKHSPTVITKATKDKIPLIVSVNLQESAKKLFPLLQQDEPAKKKQRTNLRAVSFSPDGIKNTNELILANISNTKNATNTKNSTTNVNNAATTPTLTTLDSTIPINTTTPNVNNVATIPTSDTTITDTDHVTLALPTTDNVALPTTDNVALPTINTSTTNNDVPTVEVVAKLNSLINNLPQAQPQVQQHAQLQKQDNNQVDWTTVDKANDKMQSTNLCANTVYKYAATITWYQNHCKSDFFDENADDIVRKTIEWCYKSEKVEASSKATRLFAVESILKRLKDDTTEQTKYHLKESLVHFQHLASKRVQDGLEKTVPKFALGDYIHMFGTILKQYPQYIPHEIFQFYVLFILTHTVGCRPCEICWIPMASWKLHIIKDENGNIMHRRMIYTFCFMNGKEVGDFTNSFDEDNRFGIYMNALALMLLYFERRGAINSAYDVYMDKEEFQINPDVFETTEDLKNKLSYGLTQVKNCLLQRCKLLTLTDEETSEIVQHGFPSTATKEILRLDEQDRANDKQKKPMWVTASRNNRLQTDQRFAFLDSNKAAIPTIGQSLGYKNSKKKRFGITSNRNLMHGDQNTLNLGVVDVEQHNRVFQAQTPGVANQHNNVQNETSTVGGANMRQNGFTTQLAFDFVVDNDDGTPAYELEGYFNDGFPIHKDTNFPTTVEFLQSRGRNLFDGVNHNAVDKKWVCFEVNCQDKFSLLSGLLDHMTKCHNKADSNGISPKFVCTCKKKPSFNTFTNFRKHLLSACSNDDNLIRQMNRIKNVNKNAKIDTSTKIQFACPEPTCFKQYANMGRLQEHWKSVSHNGTNESLKEKLKLFPNGIVPAKVLPKKEFACTKCEDSFTSQKQLNRHVKKDHPPKKTKQPPKKDVVEKDEDDIETTSTNEMEFEDVVDDSVDTD